MKKFIIKRILISIPVFLGITLLVYVLASCAPGSPAEMLMGGEVNDLSEMTPEKYVEVEAKLGLDQPVIVQYGKWLLQLLQGNLGTSYRTKDAVLEMIMSRIGSTVLLTLSATCLSAVIAIVLGIMSAYKPYSLWDYISSAFSFIGASMPNFFIGMLLIYFFAVKVKILPSSGMYDSARDTSLPSLLKHMILPMTTLCFQQIGSILRQTRGSMLDVLGSDFIRTSRAQGVGEVLVVLRHGLRNALIPILTVLMGMLPFIISGAVITEQIFSWPGLGSLMVQSINSRDYPVIMGMTVFISAVVLLSNLLLDVAYGIADPRIRHSRNRS
ncbi:MAG: ABC transporter permease [Lachnospiraceae bacterium]|nr:ABC transporter permease [Lachnospiraceae bacterium]